METSDQVEKKNTEAAKDLEESKPKKSIWSQGLGGIYGMKAGMTSWFDKEKGKVFPATVIQILPNRIIQVKTPEKDRYRAIQVGLVEKDARKVRFSEAGHLKKSQAVGFYRYREIRFKKEEKDFIVGNQCGLSFLKKGDWVDIRGRSKGKGFQGVMKRHGFAGGPKTHGCSVSHRVAGSIGNHTDPAKVFKGRKMASQMGNRMVTVQNLRVLAIDEKKQVLILLGAAPGSRNALLLVQKAVKKYPCVS